MRLRADPYRSQITVPDAQRKKRDVHYRPLPLSRDDRGVKFGMNSRRPQSTSAARLSLAMLSLCAAPLASEACDLSAKVFRDPHINFAFGGSADLRGRHNDAIAKVCAGEWCWIGGQNPSGSTIAWVNNAASTYTNWQANEPNSEEAEKCIVILRNGQWNDGECHEAGNYVCQCHAR